MHSEKLAIKVAIIDGSKGRESSLTVSTPSDDETKKPKESLGFVALCRIMADTGLSLRMGDIGLEPLQKTPGKTTFLIVEGSNAGPMPIRTHPKSLACGRL